MTHKHKILQLRKQGKSYNEIAKITGANKSTIAYHCGKGQKQKARDRNRINKRKHPYIMKFYRFIAIECPRKLKTYHYQRWQKEVNFHWKDIIELYSESPNCYLCGTSINIHETDTYAFDHKIPRSRGGSRTLDNLGIACKVCNVSKNNLTTSEFLEHCRKIIKINEDMENRTQDIHPAC